MKHKKMSIVVFEPRWAKKNPKMYKDLPLQLGEGVLYLGEIANVPGHCAVAKRDGKVFYYMHPEDFRKAREEEL